MTARIHTAIESMAYLRTIPYTEYRTSAWWKHRRDTYRADRSDTCHLCRQNHHINEQGERIPLKWHVHHISYDNLGDEPDDDLRLLCSRCHNLIHYPKSIAAEAWLRQQLIQAMAIGEGEDYARDLARRVKALRPKDA